MVLAYNPLHHARSESGLTHVKAAVADYVQTSLATLARKAAGDAPLKMANRDIDLNDDVYGDASLWRRDVRRG